MAIDTHIICPLFNNRKVARVGLVLKKLVADAIVFFTRFLHERSKTDLSSSIFSKRAVILASTLT